MPWRDQSINCAGNEVIFDSNHTEDEFLATIVGFENTPIPFGDYNLAYSPRSIAQDVAVKL